eukprot:5532198-Amphidinium_carterae.1
MASARTTQNWDSNLRSGEGLSMQLQGGAHVRNQVGKPPQSCEPPNSTTFAVKLALHIRPCCASYWFTLPTCFAASVCVYGRVKSERLAPLT